MKKIALALLLCSSIAVQADDVPKQSEKQELCSKSYTIASQFTIDLFDWNESAQTLTLNSYIEKVTYYNNSCPTGACVQKIIWNYGCYADNCTAEATYPNLVQTSIENTNWCNGKVQIAY
jgi:hypothetical protein